METRQLLFAPALVQPTLDPLELSLEEATSDVIMADLDGDGYVDVLGLAAKSVRSWFHRGSAEGLSTERRELPMRGTAAEAVDVDGDQDLDLVLTTSTGFSVWKNQGTTENVWLGFDAPRNYPQPSVVSIATEDFDGDGAVDLVLGTDSEVWVRRNTGDGNFLDAVSYMRNDGAKAIAVGDVDHDGNIDVVVANHVEGRVSVLHGLGDGSFEPAPTLARFTGRSRNDAASSIHMQLADFDGDDSLDLVLTLPHADIPNVLHFTGNGAGDFEGPSQQLQVIGSPSSLAIDDVDEDGLTDLIIAHRGFFHLPQFGTGPGGLSFMRNTGDGFAAASRIYARDVHAVRSANLGVDGSVDLALATSYGTVVLEQSAEAWIDTVTTRTFAGSDPRALAVGDWNLDGIADLAVADATANSVAISWGQPDGLFAEPSVTAAGSAPRVVLSGDFFQPGRPSLAIVHAISRDVRLGEVLADGQIRWLTDFLLPGDLADAATADLNHDGLNDIVTLDRFDNGVTIWLNQGAGQFVAAHTLPLSVGDSLALGDLNRDSHVDLVVTRRWEGLSVLLGRGDGSFDTARHLQHRHADSHEVRHVQIAEIDQDQMLDLVTVIEASTDRPHDFLSVWLNQGDGQFQEAAGGWHTLPADVVGLVTLDWNRDGVTDVAVAAGGLETPAPRLSPGGSVSLLLGQGNGLLKPAIIQHLATNDFTSLLAADLGGDEQSELLLANAVGVTHVQREAVPLPGDSDLDGDVDFADFLVFAANFGATSAVWQQGDFDGNQLVDFGDFLLLSANFGRPNHLRATRP